MRVFVKVTCFWCYIVQTCFHDYFETCFFSLKWLDLTNCLSKFDLILIGNLYYEEMQLDSLPSHNKYRCYICPLSLSANKSITGSSGRGHELLSKSFCYWYYRYLLKCSNYSLHIASNSDFAWRPSRLSILLSLGRDFLAVTMASTLRQLQKSGAKFLFMIS